LASVAAVRETIADRCVVAPPLAAMIRTERRSPRQEGDDLPVKERRRHIQLRSPDPGLAAWPTREMLLGERGGERR
jgi:hypothetical protein